MSKLLGLWPKIVRNACRDYLNRKQLGDSRPHPLLGGFTEEEIRRIAAEPRDDDATEEEA